MKKQNKRKQLITLYKYLSIQYAAEILEKQRLYLSDGTNFNDPFELIETNEKDGHINRIMGLHILCLTNSFQGKLMWSHYTKSHEGICITVQVPNELVYPVHYSSKRLYIQSDIDTILSQSKNYAKANIDKPLDNLSSTKKKSLLKDKKWAYEKEYRIVFDQKDEDDLKYEDEKWYFPVKITNVYLGVNFERNNKETKGKIYEACRKNGIKITRMRLSNKNYGLDIMKEGS